MSKKLTKHQIKEDKLVTNAFRAWEWAQTNTRSLLVGIVTVVALALALVLYISAQAKARQRAADLFGRASIEMQTPMATEQQAAVTDFQILLRDYGNSQWAPYGCLYLANLFYRDGQYPQARELYKKYVDEYKKDSLITSSAYAGMADCLRQEKDLLTAAEYYLKGANVCPGSILAPEYYYQAGEAYQEAGQNAKAVEVLQKLLADYASSNFADQARRKLSELTAS